MNGKFTHDWIPEDVSIMFHLLNSYRKLAHRFVHFYGDIRAQKENNQAEFKKSHSKVIQQVKLLFRDFEHVRMNGIHCIIATHINSEPKE